MQSDGKEAARSSMKFFRKKSKPAPAQSADALRIAFQHQLWKSVFFALAAVAVVSAASIAWFVSNNQVHSGTTPVSAGFEPLRLATKGQRQQADQYLTELMENKGTAVDTLEYKGETYYCTNGDPIALRLNAEKYEVSPGAHGKVTFYVIPSSAGGSVTLHIGLGGYGEIEQKVVAIDDPVLNALMSGHILLFDSYENDTYSGWLFQDGTDIFSNTITVDLSGKPAGVPVQVDFYWIWPLRYENLEELLTEEEYGYLQADSLKTHDKLNENYKYSRVFLTDKGVPADDDARSKAYDTADEYIGGNAQYLYLTIQTASERVDTVEGGQQA